MNFLIAIVVVLWIVWLLTRQSGKRALSINTQAESKSKASRYFEPPADMPKDWDCCRYCGHVYDPRKVKYETPKPFKLPTDDAYLNRMIAIHEPDRLKPERQLLLGDCPKCKE